MPDNSDAFEGGGSADPVAGDEAAATDSGDGSANKTTAGRKKRRADAVALAVLALLAAALVYLLVVRLPPLIRLADKTTPANADAPADARRQSQQETDAEPEEAPAPLKPEAGTSPKTDARRAAQKAEIADSSDDRGKQKGGALTGKRSRASIQRVVIQNAARMRYAYNQRLREKPGITGQITVKFAIDEFGGVIFAQSVESTMNDSVFENVIVGMVKDWKFETADNPGDITEVTYPFVFSQ